MPENHSYLMTPTHYKDTIIQVIQENDLGPLEDFSFYIGPPNGVVPMGTNPDDTVLYVTWDGDEPSPLDTLAETGQQYGLLSATGNSLEQAIPKGATELEDPHQPFKNTRYLIVSEKDAYVAMTYFENAEIPIRYQAGSYGLVESWLGENANQVVFLSIDPEGTTTLSGLGAQETYALKQLGIGSRPFHDLGDRVQPQLQDYTPEPPVTPKNLIYITPVEDGKKAAAVLSMLLEGTTPIDLHIGTIPEDRGELSGAEVAFLSVPDTKVFNLGVKEVDKLRSHHICCGSVRDIDGELLDAAERVPTEDITALQETAVTHLMIPRADAIRAQTILGPMLEGTGTTLRTNIGTAPAGTATPGAPVTWLSTSDSSALQLSETHQQTLRDNGIGCGSFIDIEGTLSASFGGQSTTAP